MAKSFLVPINMNGLEIQNFLAHNLATAPTGVNGRIYFNTGDKKLYYYNGTSWVALTANTNVSKTTTTPKMDGTAAIGSETKYAAGDHVHPTDTSRVPTSRTVNGKALTSNITLDTTDIDAVISGNSTLNDDVDFLYGVSQSLRAGAYKDVDTTVTANSSNLITSGAVSTAIASVDAMRFKGTIGTGGTVTTLPTSGVRIGDTYRVITAGTYAGQTCEIGDLIIAIATTPTWTVAQTNIDGAITAAGTGLSKSGTTINHSNSVSAQTTQAVYPIKIDAQGHISAYGSAVTSMTPTSHTHGNIQNGGTLQTNDVTIANGDKLVVTDSSDSNKIARTSVSFDGSTTTKALTQKGTFETFLTSHQTYTSVTGKPTANQTPGFGSTFTISQISQATSGQISATDRTVKIPDTVASSSADGLMSSADAVLLNRIRPWYGSNGRTKLTAGQTSLTIGALLEYYLAIDDSTGEEVVLDVTKTTQNGNPVTIFSITQAYTHDILIVWMSAPFVVLS